MAVILRPCSRTPRGGSAPSSLPANRRSVFRASLLQSPPRGYDAREASLPEVVEGLP
jgi:hypothetical protein